MKKIVYINSISDEENNIIRNDEGVLFKGVNEAVVQMIFDIQKQSILDEAFKTNKYTIEIDTDELFECTFENINGLTCHSNLSIVFA